VCILFKLPNAQLLSWLAVPADTNVLLHKPWTLFTYMFLHKEIFHILFNLLWFYWFAKIFLDYLDAKKLLGTYILGGIAGAIFYIAAFNLFPVFKPMVSQSVALGASASVLAVVTAISFYVPNLTMNLLFIGPVKLKYIAIGSVLIDLVSISANNPGGHIAHLGGAFWGYIFVTQYKRGLDLNKWFSVVSDWIYNIFKPRPKLKVTYKKPVDDRDYNFIKTKEQEQINLILDKISKSGYSSLSKEEKDLLFKASNK
jgi:membrane associated rhomboid family serine protease